jgi:hypothetical protein
VASDRPELLVTVKGSWTTAADADGMNDIVLSVAATVTTVTAAALASLRMALRCMTSP